MKKNIELSPNIETLFGTHDENLHLLEDGLNVSIDLKSDSIEIHGSPAEVARAEQVFADYAHLRRSGFSFQNGDLGSMLRIITSDPNATLRSLAEAGRQRATGKRTLQPKSLNQRKYLEAIEHTDMVFGIGPAGTGKTYLAVAMAVSALVNKQVNRIVLARPAVEAGERLGFLPGTLQEKVDPYLRPLYDALYDLLEAEKVDRYLEKNVIEIAPIAFMRGRTLNDSFIILDEAQKSANRPCSRTRGPTVFPEGGVSALFYFMQQTAVAMSTKVRRRAPLSALERFARQVKRAARVRGEVSVWLASDAEIRRLNRE